MRSPTACGISQRQFLAYLIRSCTLQSQQRQVGGRRSSGKESGAGCSLWAPGWPPLLHPIQLAGGKSLSISHSASRPIPSPPGRATLIDTPEKSSPEVQRSALSTHPTFRHLEFPGALNLSHVSPIKGMHFALKPKLTATNRQGNSAFHVAKGSQSTLGLPSLLLHGN